MKRRQFLQSILALVTIPILPSILPKPVLGNGDECLEFVMFDRSILAEALSKPLRQSVFSGDIIDNVYEVIEWKK